MKSSRQGKHLAGTNSRSGGTAKEEKVKKEKMMKKIKDRQLSSISAAAAAAAFIINSSQTDCEVQLLSPYLIRPKSALRSPLQESDRILSSCKASLSTPIKRPSHN